MSIQRTHTGHFGLSEDVLHDEPEAERRNYNGRICRLRDREYPMLEGTVYLDHGGTTLASKSLVQAFAKQMQQNLLSNPHSDAGSASLSASLIANTRLRVLQSFDADPAHFDVVFTANATAAIKLVADAFSGHESGFDYYFHYKCHTSLLGVGQLAERSLCLQSNEAVASWIQSHTEAHRPSLFAYPAQSNMDGERLPVHWPAQIRTASCHGNTYTLLDVAALVSTSPLSLHDHNSAPDFLVLSFYKIFGFPDLGALIVRKASAHILKHRRYFGGGTTDMIACTDELCVMRKNTSPHERLEDGTTPIRNVLALACAMEEHQRLFGGMAQISKHTTWLTHTLYKRLDRLRHANGTSVCHFYKAHSSRYGDPAGQGATLALNFMGHDGTWLGCWHVGKLLREKGIQVRTGSHCNPAGAAAALEIDPLTLKDAYDTGFRCNTDQDILNGKPVGLVRITFGAVSTMADVDALMDAIADNFVDEGEIG
ncbi:PLP-dependent transferase [Alternaria alternata]|nr:PLP-dependent transferase [Alternaria alternata]